VKVDVRTSPKISLPAVARSPRGPPPPRPEQHGRLRGGVAVSGVSERVGQPSERDIGISQSKWTAHMTGVIRYPK
jgi:hypothetical protein